MFSPRLIEEFGNKTTPFYYYDTAMLRETLSRLRKALPPEYHVHYALKANAHPGLLAIIRDHGLGADCVSGNEVKRAVACGFEPSKIVFAGVGKSDREIEESLAADIFCFNAESMPELEVLDSIAARLGKTAPVALRINPNVDAFTHRYITTGLEENKFGINAYEFPAVIELLGRLQNVRFTGLHFHIGSQIRDLNAFRNLCIKVNEINRWFVTRGLHAEHVNVGGGFGINYHQPDEEPYVDFETYFSIFRDLLKLQPEQKVHFELGRSIVGQCGSLIARVLYVKKGINTQFAILDAGMTELIRPALYQAYHKIQNLSNPNGAVEKYDVVGPICESSDCFGKGVELPQTKRGDLMAIRSAGAYGEVMSNRYNLREQVPAVVI